MRWARLVAVALLVAAGLAAPAPGAPIAAPAGTAVEAPNWVVGSEWYYSDGYAIKVTSASPKATVFDRIDAPGQWFSRQGFMRKDAVSGTATRNAIYRTLSDVDGFSLKAGSPLVFQREYLSNGKLMVHATSWAVEGRETITVPAGTFDCWLIVWRTRSLKSDWTGFERWWYSPQAQNYVRMEYKYGPAAEGSRVLMRYHIGAAGEGAASLEPSPLPQAPLAQPGAVAKEAAVKTAPLAAPVPAFDDAAVAAAPAAQSPPVSPPSVVQTAAAEPPAPSPEQPALPAEGTARPAERPAPAAEQPAPADISKIASLPRSTGGDWHAQLGSSKDAAAMRADLEKMVAGNPLFAPLPSGLSSHAVAGRGTFYRAWLGAFDKPQDAQALCKAVKRSDCAVFRASVTQARND